MADTAYPDHATDEAGLMWLVSCACERFAHPS